MESCDLIEICRGTCTSLEDYGILCLVGDLQDLHFDLAHLIILIVLVSSSTRLLLDGGYEFLRVFTLGDESQLPGLLRHL